MAVDPLGFVLPSQYVIFRHMGRPAEPWIAPVGWTTVIAQPAPVMVVAKTAAIFLVAVLTELGGAYAIWRWRRPA